MNGSDAARDARLTVRHHIIVPDLLVRPPANARGIARGIMLFLMGFAVVAALAPWRQTVIGSGQVIAFAPDQRQQNIEAPVAGRVEQWFVHEGSRVRAGDAIVALTDNDANILERLGQERAAVALRIATQEARTLTLRDRIESLRRSLRAQVSSAQAEIDIALQELAGTEQRLAAERAAQETNDLNLARQRELETQGLASRRDFELAQLEARRSAAGVTVAEALVQAARSRLAARRAALERVQASGQADLQSAEASLKQAESELASSQASLARVDVGISRQEAQQVVAPVDGTILRVTARQGGEQVDRGEVLATIVPETSDRAVELKVDGNDAALIQRGATVRLQFEGWPAIQFSGWPSVAVGTFGGKVAFVDPADDGNGNFRVVVTPQVRGEQTTEPPWPNARYLRQGVRTKGWFLLNEVSIGREIWRRFNGFPPTSEPRDPAPRIKSK